MNHNIYLVGQISNEAEETFKWRKRVEEYLEDVENLNIINPCDNNFNKNSLDETKNIYLKDGIDLIVAKDRNIVKQSDICIINLNIYDPNKPMIGSFFELAWFFDSPDKVVIGICDTDDLDNHPYTSHPFVRQSLTCWVKNEFDACDLILEYFNK